MPILLSVKKSSNPKKKWTALFRMPNTKDGKERFKSVSFGSPKMASSTIARMMVIKRPLVDPIDAVRAAPL